jgi:hypothetical protein
MKIGQLIHHQTEAIEGRVMQTTPLAYYVVSQGRRRRIPKDMAIRGPRPTAETLAKMQAARRANAPQREIAREERKGIVYTPEVLALAANVGLTPFQVFQLQRTA